MADRKYTMLDDKVLFRKYMPTESRGGVYIPARFQHMRVNPLGEVLAVGPGRLTKDGKARLPMSVAPGDIIVYDVTATVKVDPEDKGDDKDLRITNEGAVLATTDELF